MAFIAKCGAEARAEAGTLTVMTVGAEPETAEAPFPLPKVKACQGISTRLVPMLADEPELELEPLAVVAAGVPVVLAEGVWVVLAAEADEELELDELLEEEPPVLDMLLVSTTT